MIYIITPSFHHLLAGLLKSLNLIVSNPSPLIYGFRWKVDSNSFDIATEYG